MAEIRSIPLLLFPLSACNTIGARFRGAGVKIISFYPSIRYDLRNIGVEYAPENYCTVAFFSAAIYTLVFTAIVGVFLATAPGLTLPLKLVIGFFSFLGAFLFALLLHLIYPRIIAGNIAQSIDRELIFAMRDMLIQISSGVHLFSVIENIGAANYGYVSEEFRKVANKVKAGAPLLEEIENMAIRTQSEHLKRTAWQLVTAIRSGANLSNTLKGIVHGLVEYQFSLSKSFTAELNFIILVFLLIAAVLPTIGTTVLVIFSTFGMLPISREVFIWIVLISFMGQGAIIGYVYTKRPTFFG